MNSLREQSFEQSVADLQKKLEVQNRELEIEASLERVRTVAMSMNKRDDMLLVCRIISTQLEMLGTKEIRNVQTAIFYEDKGTYFNYEFYRLHNKSLVTEVAYINHAMSKAFADQMLKGPEEFFSRSLKGKELKNWYAFQQTTNQFDDTHLAIAASLNYYWYSMGPVALGISTYVPLNEDEIVLFKRFRNVFELAYRRYLDIEKAEAQSRESQIQLALERVRARTMAMQRSDELSETASEMFRQIQLLGLKAWSCGFNIIDKEKRLITQWVSTGDGRILPAFVTPSGEDVFQRFTQAAQKDKSLYVEEMGDEALKAHYQYMASLPEVKKLFDQLQISEITPPDFQVFHAASFSYGYLMFITYQPAPGFYDVFKRFAAVFDQTYRRFLDLQKAETQAKEANIEAALERVRSVAMSMMKSEELLNICEAVYKQLLLLGFTDVRAAQIYIRYDAEEKFMNYDYSDAMGGDVVQVNYNSHANTRRIYDVISNAGDGLIHNLVNKKDLDAWKSYLYNTLGQAPEHSLDSAGELHYYLYSFGIGAFGICTFKSISEDELQILKRFRNVFSLSYQRYIDIAQTEAHAIQAEEDLIKLQTEKQRAEDALTELKETQKQLVQSEKMASLGELTAGIAHEIQNPLNFVNNFSEVSKELLDEMKTALENGDEDDVKAIMNDVIKNLEKINHHGKRADAIVKGMLQHSRQTKGIKEPTDINALCDEDLRLSYHGLRAKDKNFIADFKTDFDESIGKINIVPQDISRVLLNLFNNAFYAVKPPNPLKGEQYKPLVSVTTKKLNSPSGAGGIAIIVTDNGNGIPQNIIDKIFQPFFTTKPTGQGTGLGLSLAYDIVKAHNGEIKAASKEGEGTTFIIHLPVS